MMTEVTDPEACGEDLTSEALADTATGVVEAGTRGCARLVAAASGRAGVEGVGGCALSPGLGAGAGVTGAWMSRGSLESRESAEWGWGLVARTSGPSSSTTVLATATRVPWSGVLSRPRPLRGVSGVGGQASLLDSPFSAAKGSVKTVLA